MQLNLHSIFSVMILLLFSLNSVCANENKLQALPEPLTLDIALNSIDQQHPDLRLSNADLQMSKYNLQQALSSNEVNVSFRTTARWVDPSDIAPNQKNEDHRLGLFVNKTLYDFGRRSSRIDATNFQTISQGFQYLNARQHQYIKVMQRYFDVVLADLQYYRYNEEMAVAYIQFDRLQIRKNLGQFTDVEVAEKEAEYYRIRRLRVYSQNQQRVTRSLLAQSLNRPEHLSVTVTKPEIQVNKRKLPEIDLAQKIVSDNNPLLRALRAKLNSARKDVEFAQAGSKPVLTGGLEAYQYSKETSSSDKWRAQLTLDIPLWAGRKHDAAVAKAKVGLYKIEAQLKQQEFLLQQQVLELLLNIETLQLKYEEVVSSMNFTELSLDKSRALYELEVKSDLGYSMVKFSAAERDVVQTEFDIALAWAQLDALSGSLFDNKKK